MFDSAPREVEIDGEKYEIIQEGVCGERGRAENKVSEGRRRKDGSTVVLRHVAEDICKRTLNQLNTSIKVRQQLNGKLNPLQVPEFLCGERRPGDWCATTFIPGRTLHRQSSLRFSSSRFIPPSLRIEIALRDTIGILKTTIGWTKHGLIHRDLKPGNVVTTPEGDYGVIDWEFGTTEEKLENAKDDDGMEEIGLELEVEREVWTLGTHQYMAPEVATEAHWEPTSDDFSIAMMAAETLGLNILPSDQSRILIERADGTYLKRIQAGFKQFEAKPFDRDTWGRLKTWLLLTSRPDPTARPSRAEALEYLTASGNISEI